jgi:hypothetical protein
MVEGYNVTMGEPMASAGSDIRFELADARVQASAISGILHGLVFVAPVWLVLASVVVAFVSR